MPFLPYVLGRTDLYKRYRPRPDAVNILIKKVSKRPRERHNYNPQSIPDTKRKRKQNSKSNTRAKKNQGQLSLLPKRGNRNAKRTEKYKNKTAQGKTLNKSLCRINRQIKSSIRTPLDNPFINRFVNHCMLPYI